jgi:membrane protease YdiL (CAAX protease family)
LFWGSEYQKVVQQRLDAEYETATAYGTALVQSMVAQLRFVPVVLFLMWRSGKGWASFGLVKFKVGKDILIGLGLWLVVATFDLLMLPLNVHHPWLEFYPVAIPWHRAIFLVGDCCAIGFSEELAFRGYLIPRLETATGATWKAVGLSVMLFGFVHLYKGYLGVVYTVVSAVILSVGFCLTRRIWPVAIAHAVVDFIILSHLSLTVGS